MRFLPCMATRVLILCLLAAALAAPTAAEGLIPELTPAQAAEARRILESFRTNPRGPFHRIRWFCNDGTVHPPSPPPCRERGGGYQHASLSPEAKKLAEWNIDAGTIFAGKPFEEFFDPARDHHRLKQLVLEKYLEEVDGGWIYRRAYTYRGARQIEDEERFGRRLLTRLLSSPEWTDRNSLLVTQLIGVVPHGVPDSVVRRIRNLAKAIADREPGFQDIRAKIHSAPGDEDLDAVRRYRREQQLPEDVESLAAELERLLEQRKASQTIAALLPAFQKLVAGTALAPAAREFAAALRTQDEARQFAAGARLTFEIWQQVTSAADGARNLDLLDFNAQVQEFGYQTRPDVSRATRAERLDHLLDHFRYAAGGGMLSMREFRALEEEIENILNEDAPPAERYRSSVRYLALAAEWARATVARFFGPAVRLYTPAEPLAASFLDEVVRGSTALPMANQLEKLVDDADRAAGVRHSFFGQPSSRGIMALNPGVARGRLRILETAEEAAGAIDSAGIYVAPTTAADLKPMGGILTLDSGNALSHAQLLAANLGIPNASVPSSLLAALKQREGREILYAVSASGVVLLEEWASLSAREKQRWAPVPPEERPRAEIDVSRLRLGDTRIRKLSELGPRDSGVIAGPKAANLGRLEQDFPEMVAAGIVIPFGVFHQHTRRSLPAGAPPLNEQIAAAFQAAEIMRESGASAQEVQRKIYPKLAQFRRAIETMPLLPEFERELVRNVKEHLGGAEGPYGLFIRSDTNAEDLPEFTGAGLNLTAPNQVGMANVISAIKRVWASPFSERAYEWRSRAFRRSENVYPSVILMRSVPAEKSGVLVTVNLTTGEPEEWTVNASEGVGAVVEGGVAESLLLRPDGGVRLLQQCRATYRKVCSRSGGLEILPPRSPEYLLTPDEIQQLRELVAIVMRIYTPEMSTSGEALPWDIEFGFEQGQLRLFQIRPLVRSHGAHSVEGFDAREKISTAPVPLDQPLTI